MFSMTASIGNDDVGPDAGSGAEGFNRKAQSRYIAPGQLLYLDESIT